MRVREIDCRFVRREIDVDPRVILGVDRVDAGPKPHDLLDRLLAAYPLLVAYLVLLILYAWQTTRIPSPVDLHRRAEVGAALALDRAHAAGPSSASTPRRSRSLYSYFLAPAWWAGATAPGYAAAKYLNAVVMTATLFPAYGLARLFLARRAALLVAVATAAIPSLAYDRRPDAGVARVLLVDARALPARPRPAPPDALDGSGRDAAVV